MTVRASLVLVIVSIVMFAIAALIFFGVVNSDVGTGLGFMAVGGATAVAARIFP